MVPFTSGETEKLECHVLVVGAGIAGLIAAIEARKLGADTILCCKGKAGRSGNTIVSGAGFSVCVPFPDSPDSAEAHLQDTIAGGIYLSQSEMARMVAERGAEAIFNLRQCGVDFLSENGDILRRLVPGHSHPRTIVVNPAGRPYALRALSLTLPLLNEANRVGVRIIDSLPIVHLSVEENRVVGAIGVLAASAKVVEITTAAVILAAGGGGQVFRETNNTADVTGDSYALALEAGAALRDLEFIQFYPLMVHKPARLLISNLLLNEGATLRDGEGSQFMTRHTPKGDMATRDEMSRAIFQELKLAGGQAGVFLDCRGVPKDVLEKRHGHLLAVAAHFGLDPRRDPLPVSPSVHFFCGGIRVDDQSRTGVTGLYAAGEAAAGVHGANRLGGNALTEAAVLARAAAGAAVLFSSEIGLPKAPGREFVLPVSDSGTLTDTAKIRQRIRSTMWEHAAVIRSERSLRKALVDLEECEDLLESFGASTPLELARWLEVRRMALVSRSIVSAALLRQESRGCHYREDFPSTDARLLGNADVRMQDGKLAATFEPVDNTAK